MGLVLDNRAIRPGSIAGRTNTRVLRYLGRMCSFLSHHRTVRPSSHVEKGRKTVDPFHCTLTYRRVPRVVAPVTLGNSRLKRPLLSDT